MLLTLGFVFTRGAPSETTSTSGMLLTLGFVFTRGYLLRLAHRDPGVRADPGVHADPGVYTNPGGSLNLGPHTDYREAIKE